MPRTLLLPALLLVAACGSSGEKPPPASASAPAETSPPAAPAPLPAPANGPQFVLEPASPSATRGDRITLKLVNAGKSAHAFTVPAASNSCGRFQWHVELVDASGQHYDRAWTNPMGPCGHVYIPEHEERFEPGQVATEVTIDTSQPWYLVAPAPTEGLSAVPMTEPPKRALAAGRYEVIVRGGDVSAKTELELR